MPDDSHDILVIGHNHFDPMWRRCFRAVAEYQGVTVAPYAVIEEMVFDAWLDMAPEGYSFTEGQGVVLREYLRRNPAKLPALRAQLERGTLCLVQCGETVQDSNLPAAEGLIRNFLVTMPLWEELGIAENPSLEIAWLEDAFGNSANYPQVLRGVGCTVAARLSYRSCPGEVWTGLDGTRLPLLDQVPMQYYGAPTKYPPCPDCAGRGCATCAGRGIRLVPILDRAAMERDLRALVTAQEKGTEAAIAAGVFQGWDAKVSGGNQRGPMSYSVGGEETLPDRALLEAVRSVAATCPPGISVRFGTWGDIHRRHRARLEAVVRACTDAATPELNPAMPGCMVTRRLTKQRTRAAAYGLIEVESQWANRAWHAGAPQAPPPELALAWREVAFAQFHDAITGTHIDAAYREMIAGLDRAEATATTLSLPVAGKAAPALAAETWRSHSGQADQVRLGALRVRFDRLGILGIGIGDDGAELLAAQEVVPTMHALRVGELTLESDFGDAWGQRIAPLGDVSLRGLGEFHDAVEVLPDGIRWRGRYRGGHRKVRLLTWTVTVRPSPCGRRLDYLAEVDWDTESKRLRAVFPVPSRNPTWTGEIPFGFIERRFDGAKTDWSQWTGQQNEYPILHWARHRLDQGGSVSLIADGLPCVRWQPGRFDISLLRSPEWEFCAVEPAHYDFWDTDGQRDAGHHNMRWSLWPDRDVTSTHDLIQAGYDYHRPAFQVPPFAIRGAVLVSAWKPSEDGRAWVLRLQETSGAGTQVEIDFGAQRMVTPCDLLERTGRTGSIGVASRATRWQGALHAHGILTLRLE